MNSINPLDHRPVADHQSLLLPNVRPGVRQAEAVLEPDTVFDNELPPGMTLDAASIASKSLHQRKVRTDKHTAELFCAELILAFFKKSLVRDAEDKLSRLRWQVGQMQGHEESPLAIVQQEFDDVADQFLSLHYLARQLEQEGGHDDTLEDINDALAELEQGHGQDIRAGIHAVEALEQDMAQDRAVVLGLRSDYRGLVSAHPGLQALLGWLLERHDVTELPPVVRRFIHALADDLASGWPSRDPVHLRALLDSLYHAEVLAGLTEQCRSQTAQLAKQCGVDIPLGQLLKEVAALSQDRWASVHRFESLNNGFGIQEPTAKVEFLKMVKCLVHGLPLKVYEDNEARLNLLAAAQDALDKAIEQEESA